ncbi:hypothetical protein I6A84_41950 [Frankia sp. CNm7]|uniref:Effector-associated domain-containing protein n=1 Tax=Frankia nepalensis TaxID=1836974 RepID=A0A937UMH8_9ACTN|nr:effector-associated domain EAD1-containing protein [Frankia nepalensis]MBL7497162.1 hypothetical protein [Frankia nepalensis]MBL7513104.1 hypothetical protein [Frankia nepalensis]MBL7524429.1 hypothetical protein [Frankia nepalensis]MBL7626867.1 hypothetical protein [Frankia nepalensis]
MGRGLDDEQIKALAERCTTSGEAELLLAEAGYPRAQLPMDARTPLVYWRQISAWIADGVVVDGRARLLAVAYERYPDADVFREHTGSRRVDEMPVRLAERPWRARPVARVARTPARGARALDAAAAEGRRRPSATRPRRGLGRPVSNLAHPFAYGVHPVVEDPDRPPSVLPDYIVRDHDELLRAAVDHAIGGRGSLAVLVGGPATGKSRACWEAVQSVPDDWRLWHPLTARDLVDGLPAVEPGTVVWLDEAERHLLTPGRKHGELAALGLRELLRDPDTSCVLVLGTLLPGDWRALTSDPDDERAEPHPHARALLADATISVPDAFTGPALDAARVKAAGDARLAGACAHADDGRLAQYLASGPRLLDHYRHAGPVGKALIEATMDVRRLGHGRALPLPLLEAAVPAYLTDAQWQDLPDNWFRRALVATSERWRGLPGPLSRDRARPGQFETAPRARLAAYLDRYGRQARRTLRPPGLLWEALSEHATVEEAARLGDSAFDRLLYGHAISLYRRARYVDDDRAMARLADLLALREDLDGLLELTEIGGSDDHAAMRLGELVARLPNAEENRGFLWDEAAHGAGWAARRLVELAGAIPDSPSVSVEPESEPEPEPEPTLREFADLGNEWAAVRLAELLADRGDIQALRARADDDVWAALMLADLLTERGDDIPTAVKVLERHAAAGNGWAVLRTADLLVSLGNVSEAEILLSTRAAADPWAALRLVTILEMRGDRARLRELANLSAWAAMRLASLAAERHDEESLREWASDGDGSAARRLAELLAERDDVEGVRELAEGGAEWAALCLAVLLARRGDAGGLRARAAMGDRWSTLLLADLLVQRNDVSEATTILRRLAEDGDWLAADWLADGLAERRDADGLRALVDLGHGWVVRRRLADTLVRLGRPEEADRLLRFGLTDTGDTATDPFPGRRRMWRPRGKSQAGPPGSNAHPPPAWPTQIEADRRLSEWPSSTGTNDPTGSIPGGRRPGGAQAPADEDEEPLEGPRPPDPWDISDTLW